MPIWNIFSLRIVKIDLVVVVDDLVHQVSDGSSHKGYFSILSMEFVVLGDIALPKLHGLFLILSTDFNISLVLSLESEQVIGPGSVKLGSVGVAPSGKS